MYERRIVPIEGAVEEVKRYFHENNELFSTFIELASYTRSIDSKICICLASDFVGVSRPDSNLHFFVHGYGARYCITFKTKKTEIFDSAQMEKYKGYCRDAVTYINETPGCIYFKEENKILEDSQIMLQSLGNVEISCEIFGVRAYNALRGAGINTYGQLAGKTAQDLLEIKNFGKTSLSKICEVLQQLPHLQELEEKKKARNEESQKNKERKETYLSVIRMRTHTLLLGSRNKLLFDNDEITRVATNFNAQFSEIIQSILKSATNPNSERKAKILYERVFNNRSLQDIAEEYGVSRERIRQICVKETRRYKARITRYIISDEHAENITKLICDVEGEQFFDCMAAVKKNNEFLWEILSGIVAEKDEVELLNEFLDSCYDMSISAEEKETPDGDTKKETKMKYKDWQKEKPNTVLLVKAGYFYSAYGSSAEVLNKVLGYKLYYTPKTLTPTTGSPNLDKIRNALEKEDISYAVILDGKIEISFEGSKGIADFVTAEIKSKKLLDTIEMMQQGVDPTTGEILELDNFLLSEDVQKILKIAKAEIIKNPELY
jgi:predicted transcriptional regulator